MITEHDIRANLYSFYKAVGKVNSLSCDLPDNIECNCMPGMAWPSYILGGENLEKGDIKNIAKLIQAGKLPAFWIRETDSVTSFDDLAGEHGIRLVMTWTGMKMELRNKLETFKEEKELKLEIIHNKKDIEPWIEVIHNELLTAKEIMPDTLYTLLDDEQFTMFTLKKQGRIVSTLLGFVQNKIAGIYLVSTLSEERGKGYGTIISSEVLNHYLKNGINSFVLHSTPLGLHLYHKIGFEEVSEFGVYWMVGKL